MTSTHRHTFIYHKNTTPSAVSRLAAYLICILCVCTAYAAPAVSQKEIDAALKTVDRELSMSDGYIANRQQFIERLKRDLDSIPTGTVSLKKNTCRRRGV